MNLFGSYRALLGNSISALSAAIEIYNKPKFNYRDECFVILLINAWELLLKAILSKTRMRIFYKKKYNSPYRTLSINDALKKCEPYFPGSINYKATANNLELLIEYRDNCIHYYNDCGLSVVIYALAQTCIVNYRDLVSAFFNRNVTEEITLTLLPLSFAPPVDPIQFLKKTPSDSSKAVAKFTERVKSIVLDLENSGDDTGRLLTIFEVQLVSTKKATNADFIVGVQDTVGSNEKLYINRITDPNKSHPFREVDVIGKKSDPDKTGMNLSIDGNPLTQTIFRALVHKYKVKEDLRFCWVDSTGAVIKYSPSFIDFIKRLKKENIAEAIETYRTHLRVRQHKK